MAAWFKGLGLLFGIVMIAEGSSVRAQASCPDCNLPFEINLRCQPGGMRVQTA